MKLRFLLLFVFGLSAAAMGATSADADVSTLKAEIAKNHDRAVRRLQE